MELFENSTAADKNILQVVSMMIELFYKDSNPSCYPRSPTTFSFPICIHNRTFTATTLTALVNFIGSSFSNGNPGVSGNDSYNNDYPEPQPFGDLPKETSVNSATCSGMHELNYCKKDQLICTR